MQNDGVTSGTSVLASDATTMDEPKAVLGAYRLTPLATAGALLAAFTAASVRLILAIQAGLDGRMDPLNAFGFSVILPLTLILLIMSLGPNRTRESGLMRVGTMIQLILIMSLPNVALHLLLGLPLVFLAVEIFETRLPRRVRDPVARILVR